MKTVLFLQRTCCRFQVHRTRYAHTDKETFDLLSLCVRVCVALIKSNDAETRLQANKQAERQKMYFTLFFSQNEMAVHYLGCACNVKNGDIHLITFNFSIFLSSLFPLMNKSLERSAFRFRN